MGRGYSIVYYHGVNGNLDAAFAPLGQLLPLGNADMKAWIRGDLGLDPLHAGPRWESIERLVQCA